MTHAEAENIGVVIRRHHRMVVFSVEDDGKGFDVKSVETEEATQRGLGLTTMAARVRIMGGVLDLSSQEKKGTRVNFIIPMGKEPPQMVSYEIVLADDHAMMRQGLRKIIEGVADLQVIGEAADGIELLSLLDRITPHMVILDLSMPNLPESKLSVI